jgi:pimeloyl-ACP methyl ester carboxylesterase
MAKTVIFAALLFIAAAALITGVVNGIVLIIYRIRRKDTSRAASRAKKNGIVLAAACVLCSGFVWFTQLTASTPAIRDESGEIIPGSIAELRRLTLNGRKEWISIRGDNQVNPILLFLAGGPGGSQIAAVRHDLSELEKHFIVVNWDQPGAAKSYGAAKNITPETYVEDGYALTRYLLERFGQEKIYLVGESWGSALGIFLIDKAPELYFAFVGTGQMIDFVETDIMDYELAMDIARERGDNEKIGNVYPQLYEIDMRTDYTDLDVPVYFFLGRHDVNAPVSLVEDYIEALDAPRKEIVWFEHSGHSPWINESSVFASELLKLKTSE